MRALESDAGRDLRKLALHELSLSPKFTQARVRTWPLPCQDTWSQLRYLL